MKTALVTGGSRGIGFGIATALAKEGWNLVINGVRAEESITGPLDELRAHGVNVGYARGDIGSVEGRAGIVATATELAGGSINLLVNNAGVADFGPIEGTTFERWRRVMATNLDGVFLMTQAFTPALRDGRGAIVNIASISALRASTLRVAYGTSKAGVAHLTQQQAVELGEFGIRANCVCPGPVRTKLAMAVHTQDIIDAYHDAIPLNRYGNEGEIAEAIVWLCSDKASYITGQRLAVDGGFEATGIGLPSLRQ